MRKETYATEQYHRVRARKQLLRAKLAEYKATLSCMRCGFSHPAALDFHHRDPQHKLVEIAGMVNRGFAWDAMLAEIAKCDVLCSNCHRIEHSSVLPNG